MAQVIVSTLGNHSGSVNVSVKLNDDDLERIYNAYKHRYAVEMLRHKTQSGAILEASDTVENLITQIDTHEILRDIVDRFMRDLVHTASNIEQRIILEKNVTPLIEYDL